MPPMARIRTSVSVDRDRHHQNPKHDMIARKLGALPAPELRVVQDKLRDILGL